VTRRPPRRASLLHWGKVGRVHIRGVDLFHDFRLGSLLRFDHRLEFGVGLKRSPVLLCLIPAGMRQNIDERVVRRRRIHGRPITHRAQIVLREVGHRDVGVKNEREVAAAVEALPDKHLKARLETADIVIVGTVERVRQSGIKEPISFHSPRWMYADVKVANPLKGGRKGEKIALLFPSGRDVLWAGAHRFAEHEEGVFLLHRGAAKWGAPPDALTALDPADFQPSDALPRIQQLLTHDQ